MGPAARPSVKKACVFLLLFGWRIPRILFIQKAKNRGYAWSNQVALPGGHIDPKDPSPLHTAYRELHEELNIPENQVDLLGSMGHFQTINSTDIEVFAGWWNEKGPVRADPREISKVLEVPLETLFDIHHENGFSGEAPDIADLVYPVDDVRIWGATARIIYHFIETIRPFFCSGSRNLECGSMGFENPDFENATD